jgi:hypothetical protein
MIRLVELTTGDLMILLEDKETLQRLNENCESEDSVLYGMMDSPKYLGNGWYYNETIGLTEAPNICKGAIYWDSIPNEFFKQYLEYVERLISQSVDETPLSYKSYANSELIEMDLPIDFAKIWYYPDYMIKSFVKELLDNGFVIFKRAR